MDISIRGNGELVLDALLSSFLSQNKTRASFLEGLPRLLADVCSPLCTVSISGGGCRTVGKGRPGPMDPARRPWTDQPTYFDVFPGKEVVTAMLQRGCSFGRCTFCSEGGAGYAPGETSTGWINELGCTMPEAALYFQDSIFPSTAWSRSKLLPALKESGLEWGCQLYLKTVSPSFLQLIAAAGCTYVYTGLESASPDVLEAVGKAPQSPGEILKRLDWVAEAGLRVGISIMLGGVSTRGEVVESHQTINSTARLAHQIIDRGFPVTGFYPNVLTVLPGTPLAAGLKNAGFELDFYTMPRAHVFQGLEDGEVGYNLTTIPQIASTLDPNLAGQIRDAAAELSGLRGLVRSSEADPAFDSPLG